MEDKTKENYRITLAIGILAGLLTLIYGIDKFIAKTGNVVQLGIRSLVYVYLGVACISLLIFLLIKASSLRYNKERVWLLRRAPSEKIGNFFYDFGVDTATYSPFGAFLVVYSQYSYLWISNLLGIGENFSIFLAFVLIIILTFLVSSIWRYIGYKLKLD